MLPDLQRFTSTSSKYQHITYNCPNTERLRFYSLRPPNPETGTGPVNAFSGYSASRRLESLYDRYHPRRESDPAVPRDHGHLDRTIALINTVHQVRTGASKTSRNIAAASHRPADFDDGPANDTAAERFPSISSPTRVEGASSSSLTTFFTWFAVRLAPTLNYGQSSAISEKPCAKSLEGTNMTLFPILQSDRCCAGQGKFSIYLENGSPSGPETSVWKKRAVDTSSGSDLDRLSLILSSLSVAASTTLSGLLL